MSGPVRDDGSLNEATVVLLHAVAAVDVELLGAARIRPSRSNWLRAPWYRYHSGGAITVGRTIWFSRLWYEPHGLGDGSPRSNWCWLAHLAHEVGHLPQAEYFGRNVFGKARYLAAFTWQYGSQALLLKKDIHDGARMEREADMGRWVLLHLFPNLASQQQLASAVSGDDSTYILDQCSAHATRIKELQAEYHAAYLAR